jgi:hypothetical protein
MHENDEAALEVVWIEADGSTREVFTGPRKNMEVAKAGFSAFCRQEVQRHFEATGEFIAVIYQERGGDGEIVFVDLKTGGVEAMYLPPEGTPESDAWIANWKSAEAEVRRSRPDLVSSPVA